MSKSAPVNFSEDYAAVFGLTPVNYPKHPTDPVPTAVKETIKVPNEYLKLTEAIKHDQGKLDWSLVPIDSVEEILKVLEFGKKKYAAWNWAQGSGFKYSRLFGSLCRHIFAWWRGEDKDPETGLSHLSHAACNLLFLIYYIKHSDRYNNDDRP